jgi:hypothetical protein
MIYPNTGRKVFFSEEKKQKTFANWSRRNLQRRAQLAKVFWFFFSEKNKPLLLNTYAGS